MYSKFHKMCVTINDIFYTEYTNILEYRRLNSTPDFTWFKYKLI